MIKLLLASAGITLAVTAFGQNNYEEISLADLMRKWQSGNKNMIILDVRSRGEHDDSSQFRHLNIGKIKGAINVPSTDLQQKPETIRQLDQYRDKEIYVICSHSYRSRNISNLLLKNNFTRVINVRGGMSEWFRDYDALKPFAAANYQKTILYNNLSPSQLFDKLNKKEPVVFIAFKNLPKNSFDSLVSPYVQHLPEIKGAEYYFSSEYICFLMETKLS